MFSKSIVAHSEQDLKDQVTSQIDGGLNPTLAIIFSGHNKNINQISAFFEEKGIAFMGCSTAGEIAGDSKYDNHIVVLLLTINKNHFKIYHEEYLDKDESTIIKTFADRASKDFKKPAFIVLNSGIFRDAEKIVDGIKKYISSDTKILGGLAGDGGDFKETKNFSSQGIFNDALLTLVLDNDKIKVEGIAVSGWDGHGGMHTITKANGNKIYKINDVDALDFFLDHFGLENFYDEDRENIISMPGNFPMKFQTKNGFEKLRCILNYDDENKALVLTGRAEVGQTFKFCLPPSIDVLDNAVDKFGSIAAETPKVDAVILISCMARKIVFGPLILKEFEGIMKIWKSPMIGFFSYGELGKTHEDDYCNFHNCTSSLVTLTEI